MEGIDAFKVYIYGTWRDRVLIFDEPDFPEVGFQIPGGTLEPGEATADGAAREFLEETGLPCPALRHIVTEDYRFSRHGKSICHRRSYFHGILTGDYPESWIRLEMTPSGGGDPIRFRFFWVSAPEARTKLGFGFANHVDLIFSSLE